MENSSRALVNWLSVYLSVLLRVDLFSGLCDSACCCEFIELYLRGQALAVPSPAAFFPRLTLNSVRW